MQKNNQQKDISRIKRNRPGHRVHVDGMGLIIVCAVVLGGLGVGGYKMYQQKQIVNSQEKVTYKPASNLVALKVRTYPKSTIFADGNEIGQADKHGYLAISGLKIGSKLTAQYGKNHSQAVLITKASKGRSVHFTYNYLQKRTAQDYFNNLYHTVTELANENDQTTDNGSLEDFYVNKSNNQSYKDIFNWSKAQYKQIQKSQDDDFNSEDAMGVGDEDSTDEAQIAQRARAEQQEKDKEAQNGFSSVHFIVHVKGTSLNSDGTVNVQYTVKYDFAGKERDHVEVFKWNANLRKKGTQWDIVKATPSPNPVSSYDD